MSRVRLWPLMAVIALTSCTALAATPDSKGQDPKPESDSRKPEGHKFEPFKAEAVTSSGSVTIGGRPLAYQAIAGTLIVHPKGWDDVPRDPASEKPTPAGGEEGGIPPNPSAEAAMFYVAYFKSGGGPRPVTFFYNGGPGSATLWLHMGAFGPRRIVTATDKHTPAAPYSLTNNAYSLLDATDMVFIDAPGTGFSRIAGKDKEKAFYGVDQDAYAFSEFISQFLSKYGRWNSPKYLFGESYGTPRSAVVVNELEADRSVDLNGVILLSQILNFDLSPDRPTGNPGVDLPYQTVLPTYAATAWYHHKLPNAPKELKPLLAEVEKFAMTDYTVALAAGATLDPAQKKAIAEKLHNYTGLPTDYILKANLRVYGGEFEKMLQDDADQTTGRLDSRFSGPNMDPLDKDAQYDPQSAAISSAYVAALNDYVRRQLKFGDGLTFHEFGDVQPWDWKHRSPGLPEGFFPISTNVMPDLAVAMKYNPQLHVLLTGGYYDLATPYFAAVYEMRHLPIPDRLQSNIEYAFYESGHMVYAHEESLKKIHDDVAAFIGKTDNVGK